VDSGKTLVFIGFEPSDQVFRIARSWRYRTTLARTRYSKARWAQVVYPWDIIFALWEGNSRSETGRRASSLSKTKELTHECANSWAMVGMTHHPVNRGTPLKRDGVLAPMMETNSWEPSGRIRVSP
jgi:hypothetical protein